MFAGVGGDGFVEGGSGSYELDVVFLSVERGGDGKVGKDVHEAGML